MALSVASLRTMVAAGATAEMLLAVVEAEQAAEAELLKARRAKDAARQRKRRASKMSRGVRVTPRDSADAPQAVAPTCEPVPQIVGVAPADIETEQQQKERSPTPPKEKLYISSRGADFSVEFEIWYAGYPHKVGRGAAFKSFVRVRRSGISLQMLTEGRDRYIRGKPVDVHWCNPATWLNQERWADQPADHVPRQGELLLPITTKPTEAHHGQATDAKNWQRRRDVQHADFDELRQHIAECDAAATSADGGHEGGRPAIRLVSEAGRR